MTISSRQIAARDTLDVTESLAFWGREFSPADRLSQAEGVDPLSVQNAQPAANPEPDAAVDLARYQWDGPVPRAPLKRAFDLLAALLLILFLLPLMAVVFVLLKVREKGPAFYWQERVGQRGKPFPVFKFRTMTPNAEAVLQSYLDADPAAALEWAAVRKLKNDPRVTALGGFLRRSSIDELPQLFNVVRGEMSLVGPRPVIADDLKRYGLEAIHYLRQRPGITGLWQVSGRSSTTYQQRVNFDRAYSLRRSFGTDLRIIFLTVPAVFGSKGAV